MIFTRLIAPQARALTLVTRSFASSSRVAGPRSLATPSASTVSSSKPSSQELANHYNKFLDVYENDELLVSTHTLKSRAVTHYPVEEVLEASEANSKLQSNAAPTATAADNADTYSPTSNVHFIDGRESKLSFA